MGTPYETDAVAWAFEQAALLRSGQLSAIDALNIAEEIEDVGKSTQRDLKSRLTVLVAHLLKWKFQPDHRGKSWLGTIRIQRGEIDDLLDDNPSLSRLFEDEDWLRRVWRNATVQAESETALTLPSSWVWPVEQVLDRSFFPD